MLFELSKSVISASLPPSHSPAQIGIGSTQSIGLEFGLCIGLHWCTGCTV